MKKEISNNNKEAKNNITEIVFILDRSGSMSGLESDTIGGFNSMIAKQKKEDGECYVTTVLFDSMVETLHDRVKLSEIKDMTEKEYFVRGSTALLDAIGSTIKHIGNIHKYAREEDVPAHTIFVITTDGMENSSREYSSDKVKKMIEKKKAKGWEFLFLGANIDAVREAGRFGIQASRAVKYEHDGAGTRKNFCVLSNIVGRARGADSAAQMSAMFDEEDVLAEIRVDYQKRHKN